MSHSKTCDCARHPERRSSPSRVGSRRVEESGFTLIELLTVVLVLMILAGITIPSLIRQRQRGWQAQLTSEVRNVAIGIEAVGVAQAGAYPADWAAVTAPGSGVDLVGLSSHSWTYVSTGSAFCLAASHPRLAQGVAVYDSAAGGLQDFLDGDADATDNC